MAEFIDFEAEADNISEDGEIEIDDPMMNDNSEDQTNNESSFFRSFILFDQTLNAQITLHLFMDGFQILILVN